MSETYISLTDELPVRQPAYHATGAVRAIARQAWCVALVLVPVAIVAGPLTPTTGKVLTVAVATAIWVLSLRTSDRGPGPSALALGTCLVIMFRTAIGLVAVSVLVLWLPSVDADTQHLLLMAGGVFLASWLGTVLQRSATRRRVLLVGADQSIRALARELETDPGLPFDLVGIIDDEPGDRIGDLPVLGGSHDLTAAVRATNADLVVLGTCTSRAEVLSQMLELDTLDVRLVDVHHFSEHAFGRVAVDQLSCEWFMGVLHLYQRPYSQLVKRMFDVVIASVALVITAPVIGAVYVAQRMAGGGPAFFRQMRLGEGGELFEILKFRTMVDSAESTGGRLGQRARRTHHAHRPHPATDAAGRVAAALERAARRDEHRRPEAGAAGVRGPAEHDRPLLDAQAPGQARHHRVGADPPRVHRGCRRHSRQARLRPVLPQVPQPAVRSGDRDAHHRHRVHGLRLPLDE